MQNILQIFVLIHTRYKQKGILGGFSSHKHHTYCDEYAGMPSK